MTTINYQPWHVAASVEIQIDQDTQTATLHFEEADKPGLIVTIPLEQLRALHNDIARELHLERPQLVRGKEQS
jgi:hypothetical protein